MTAIAALYSDEEGLCVVQGEGEGRGRGGGEGGGRGEGGEVVSAYWKVVCHMTPSSHLIGYFSPVSLPRWKSKGSEEWFTWV